MVIYYSGNSSRDVVPEALVVQRSPAIMLTFHDIYQRRVRDTMRRFAVHQKSLIKRKKANGPVLDYQKPKKKHAKD